MTNNIKYITYVWYANAALSYNEFLAHTSNPEGQLYDCKEPGGFENPACKPYTGVYIMDSLGFPFKSLWEPTLILVAMIILFFFGAAILLQFRPAQLSISQAHPNGKDFSAGEQTISQPHPVIRGVNVALDNYHLAIQKRSMLWRNSSKICVLKPITTTFESGILNVIMGPSGSGKTYLLPFLN